MRGDRLGVNSQQVYILTETSMELIREQVIRLQPRVLVIDSIQTVFTADLASAPGSVSQVRESTAHLMALAKTLDVPILIYWPCHQRRHHCMEPRVVGTHGGHGAVLCGASDTIPTAFCGGERIALDQPTKSVCLKCDRRALWK
jgi:hypothetical protein